MAWAGAVAAVALVAAVACDGGADPATGRAGAAPTTAAPVATVAADVRVVADFAVAPAAPDTKLSGVSARSLPAGRGSVVVVAVERPVIPPRCIVSARLRLFVEESVGSLEEELAVYPSHVFDVAAKRDGDRFGHSGALLDVRPRATYEDGGGGWSEWDVTAIFRRWGGRRTFPSMGRRAPERGPVVLALRDVDLAEPFATATISSSDAATNVPYVTVAARAGCPARGRA